ncbi:high mobility group protein 20A-like [Rhopalosiphum maidis]|uniref:high mobility group protein 20A-like n=1 Tax=Rhopalosiphum maidis TaxID=43146 RepID=UPI000F00E35E|nr:high mobility group protein 20A-like [Rhopalosiphum maidis]
MESKNAESIDKSDQDVALIENGIPKKVDKNNVQGKRRRKCLRVNISAIPPDSAYIRFLNDRRKRFRSNNPNLSFAEITKINTEWNRLPADKKQKFHSAAECSKCVKKLVAAYKKTKAYKNCIQREMKKKKINTQIQEDKEDEEFKKEKSPGDIKLKKEQELIKIEPSYNNINTVYDIPTFSDEFSIFNNARESELRYLQNILMDELLCHVRLLKMHYDLDCVLKNLYEQS